MVVGLINDKKSLGNKASRQTLLFKSIINHNVSIKIAYVDNIADSCEINLTFTY